MSCHVRIRVSENLGDDVDRHAVLDGQRGERMPLSVESDRLCKEKLASEVKT